MSQYSASCSEAVNLRTSTATSSGLNFVLKHCANFLGSTCLAGMSCDRCESWDVWDPNESLRALRAEGKVRLIVLKISLNKSKRTMLISFFASSEIQVFER